MTTSKICNDLNMLHPYARERAVAVLEHCKSIGLDVDIFETGRTEERQKWLFANGYSKTLNSYHRLGLAVDFVFKTKSGNWTWRVANSRWDQLAQILEAHGFYSLWKRKGWDGPHGQINLKGVTVSKLYKELDSAGGNVEVFWNRCVDPELEKMGIWKKPAVETLVEPERQKSTVAHESVKPVLQLKSINLFQLVYQFILRIFSGAK